MNFLIVYLKKNYAGSMMTYSRVQPLQIEPFFCMLSQRSSPFLRRLKQVRPIII